MSETSIPEEFYEKFPEPTVKIRLIRIWEKVEETWGTEDGMKYLESLLIVEEGRTREGFDSIIISEIFLLGKLHEEAYPQFEVTKLGADFIFEDDHKETEDF
jgi:hypothetical protein